MDAKTQIHPTAIVHKSAELGQGVVVGPYSIIGENVVIGDGTQLGPHVFIDTNTTIGRDCRIMTGAALGGPPQDYKYKDEPSYLKIGDGNVIREYVTIHRASGEGRSTIVGSNNLLMAYCHIGHNCTLGNNITMANTVGVSGHVVIEDKVVFGGIVGVHQNVRIGKLAMIGGFSKVAQDVPPFMISDGRPTKVYDLNVVGLRRSGVSAEVRAGLRLAHKILYRSDLNVTQALKAIKEQIEPSEELQYLVDFISSIREGHAGRQLEAPRG